MSSPTTYRFSFIPWHELLWSRFFPWLIKNIFFLAWGAMGINANETWTVIQCSLIIKHLIAGGIIATRERETRSRATCGPFRWRYDFCNTLAYTDFHFTSTYCYFFLFFFLTSLFFFTSSSTSALSFRGVLCEYLEKSLFSRRKSWEIAKAHKAVELFITRVFYGPTLWDSQDRMIIINNSYIFHRNWCSFWWIWKLFHEINYLEMATKYHESTTNYFWNHDFLSFIEYLLLFCFQCKNYRESLQR